MATAVTTPYLAPSRSKAVIQPSSTLTTNAPLNDSAEAKAQAAELTRVHSAFATKFVAEQAAARKAALGSKATFAGFGVTDIGRYFGVDPVQAEALISRANGGTLTPNQTAALQALNPSRFKGGAGGPHEGFGDIVWGLQHLAEHPAGSHYHGDFNVGEALTRGVAATLTGGFSELSRARPFQPGGGGVDKLDLIPGVGVVNSGVRAVMGGTKPPGVPAPAAPKPAPDQAAARQALDKADLERRRSLAGGTNMTSALGLPGDATVKRSVLG